MAMRARNAPTRAHNLMPVTHFWGSAVVRLGGCSSPYNLIAAITAMITVAMALSHSGVICVSLLTENVWRHCDE